MKRDHFVLDRVRSRKAGEPVFRVAARRVPNIYQSAWARGAFGFKKWLKGGKSA